METQEAVPAQVGRPALHVRASCRSRAGPPALLHHAAEGILQQGKRVQVGSLDARSRAAGSSRAGSACPGGSCACRSVAACCTHPRTIRSHRSSSHCVLPRGEGRQHERLRRGACTRAHQASGSCSGRSLACSREVEQLPQGQGQDEASCSAARSFRLLSHHCQRLVGLGQR